MSPTARLPGVLPWACLLLLCTTTAGTAANDERRPPNVLFILADDLGWTDLGCYGSSFYETPNVDRLSEEGVRFVNGYAACPVCSPTRASLMTGKYPARLGLTAHIGDAQPDNWKRNSPLIPPRYLGHLPLDEVTIAEQFHDAGYATFHAGKWHLGGSDRYWPEYQGFDGNVGGWLQGGPFGGKQYFSPYGNPRIVDGPPGEHLPDRLARECVRFIESHRHKPFFACLSFYSVHVPLVAKAELEAKYRQKLAQMPPIAEDAIYTTDLDGKTRVRQVHSHATYAAMIESMDDAVGRVLKALDDLKLADNTIVVFTSDNGGLSTGDRGISADQGWPTSNAPLRNGKGWMYEGGIRVPLIVRSPDCKAGAVSKTVVTSTDFYPTLLEMAGVAVASDLAIDGVSIASAIEGAPLDRGPVFWHYPHYGNQGGRPAAAVRAGDWKLIEWYGENELELFDLANDIGETTNVAQAQPAIFENLRSTLQHWRERMDAKLPTPNQNFVPNDAARVSRRAE